MRKPLAFIPLGLFGVAGYAIAFRAIPPGNLAATVDEITPILGRGLTGALVLCIGIVLTWLMFRKHGQPG